MPAAVIGAAWSHGGRTADIAAAVGPPTLAEADVDDPRRHVAWLEAGPA
jgi:hypothetical protein